MAKISVIQLSFFLFFVKNILTEEHSVCETTYSWYNGIQVEWPSTTSLVSSNPPCVGQNKEFLTRSCFHGLWGPEPDCDYIQKGSIPACPENFKEHDNICYTFSQKSTFPPQCPFTNTIPFDSYINIIELSDEPIWVPVKRNFTHNGLGFLQWIEDSFLYGKEFIRPFTIDGGIKGKDCVVYFNSEYYMSSCNEKYRGVCAYYKLYQISGELCEDDSGASICRVSDFGAQSKCFCQGTAAMNQSLFLKVEFIKIYQNKIYETLTSDVCAIGLERVNGTYIWANSNQEISYTFWSKEVNFTNTYGAIRSDGWLLTPQPSPCFLYEKPLDLPEPKLTLMFSDTENKLIVNITNPKSLKPFSNKTLVYCFTDAGYHPIYSYEILEVCEEESCYYFSPHAVGPGNYWCHSFKYFDPTPVTSEVIFVNQSQFGQEFVGIFLEEYVKGTNPLTSNASDFFREFFINLTPQYTTRVMKIIDLDEDLNQVTVNLHFTYQTRNLPEAPSLDEEFVRVRNNISEILNQQGIKIEMTDFLSATHCLPDGFWPMTPIGNSTVGVYCFNIDGILIERRCEGNFIDGARWAKTGECEPATGGDSVTERLLDLLFDDCINTEDLDEIIKWFKEFTSFDTYLTLELATKCFDKIQTEKFVEIVDQILEVDRSVLVDGQRKMRLMDRLLHVIDQIAISHNLNSSNFLTVRVNGSNMCGLGLYVNHSVVELNPDNTLNDIVEDNDVESAIWVSSILCSNQIEEKQSVIFKFYFNDVFFLESGSETSTTVGVVFPNGRTGHEIRVFHRLASPLMVKEDCAYWSYDLNRPNGRGSWIKTGMSQNVSLAVFCDFSLSVGSIMTFISSESPSQKVSEDLEGILESNDTASEIISKLLIISERYDEFSSYDVYLVGQILRKVNNNSDINLQNLVQVVSNLHRIERPILSQSQDKARSTDSILHNVDTILKNQNFNTSVNATSENFFVLIADLQATNFSGLLLLDTNQTLETRTLTGDITTSDVLKSGDFSSAVLLSPVLRHQMQGAKVVVTIFSNDGLFNENGTETKTVSKIFGVILPEVANFSDPVVILHKIKSNNKQCVHWMYNNTHNVSGAWMEDNKGASLPDWSQCEFWHTTHFALLLLDEDKYDSELLDWITMVNCALSSLGLACFILTAVFFKRWRANTGNQILLNFVFALLLQIGVFYVSSVISKDNLLCTIIGIVLHYSIVSQFCWMFVIAILQFKRFVEVFGGPPKYILLKACLCGWVLPCLPVASVYVLDQNNYVNGHVGLCYPSGLGLYLGVWLPVLIVVVINLVIFLYIIYSVVHKKTECSDVGNSVAMFQWRLAVLLFFMLGLTWSFGFLSELDFGLVFVYVFCFSATLQGFIMFLFFIVFNSNTRYLYTSALKKCCNKKY